MLLPGNLKKSVEELIRFKKINFNSALFVLVFCNIFVFITQFLIVDSDYSKVDQQWKKIETPAALKSVHQMYLKTLDPLLVDQGKIDLKRNPYIFLKDENFWIKASLLKSSSDPIQLKMNQEVIKKIQLNSASSKAHIFGLGSKDNTILNWLTYQFTHSHFFHLFFNMVFLFVSIQLLRKTVSDFYILLAYIFSGFAAGVAYLYWSTDHLFPMVGASGSIAGLLGFLIIIKGRTPIEWTYFLPIKNGIDVVHFPAYYIFPFFLMSDFTELIKVPFGSSHNIALNAHVGGALFGLFFGLCYLQINKLYSLTEAE
jgi:membrane associated rhomboid family serine protease